MRVIHSFARIGLLTTLALAAACGTRASDAPAVPTGPAPDSFRVTLQTSRGPVVVEALRSWAPNGVDRFYALTKTHFFDENRFFRVVPEFIVQSAPSATQNVQRTTLPPTPLGSAPGRESFS